MGASEFYVDWEVDVSGFSEELTALVEERLLELAADHTDLTGAAASITAAAKNDLGEPIRYRARIVVYTRPEYINASKEDDSLQGALKAALAAVERQVREKRTKLGKPWEREDLKTEGLPPDALVDGVTPEDVITDEVAAEFRKQDDAR